MSATKSSAGSILGSKNKGQNELAQRVWLALCEFPPEKATSGLADYALKLFGELGSEIKKAPTKDKETLEALVEKDESSLNRVGKPLLTVLLKVRGLARACKPAKGPLTESQSLLPGSALKYDTLDLE